MSRERPVMEPKTVATIVLFALLQLTVYVICRRKITEIREMEEPAAVRLRLMEKLRKEIAAIEEEEREVDTMIAKIMGQEKNKKARTEKTRAVPTTAAARRAARTPPEPAPMTM